MVKYLDIVDSLFRASLKAAFIVGFLLGAPMGLGMYITIGDPLDLLTPVGVGAVGMLVGTGISVPAILVGAKVIVVMLNRQMRRRAYFTAAGLLVGGVYGALLALATSSMAILLFLVGGALAGFIVHSDVVRLTIRSGMVGRGSPISGKAATEK
jgi:hypothetical protein